MPGFLRTTLWTTLVLVALCVGIPVFDRLRTLPTQIVSGSEPPTEPYTPQSYTNTTQLQQTCQAACFGGNCTQNAITGITNCLTCPSTMTRDPATQLCVDTSYCVLWPWCSATHAATLQSIQTKIANISTQNTPIAYGLASVTALANQVGVTNTQMTDLCNEYYNIRSSLISQQRYTQPTQYWDDQDAMSASLDVYRSQLIPEYVDYVTSMKRLVCVGSTWVAKDGTCVAPV